jgi:hypothetical protein
MMRTTVEDIITSDSDDDDDDLLFSPVQGRRSSLHDFLTPTTPASRETPPPPADSLPRLQDRSWIGAKVSPIPATNEEDGEVPNDNGDDAIRIVAPKFRSIHDASFVRGSNAMSTETSSLLGQRRSNDIHQRNNNNNNNQVRQQQQLQQQSSTFTSTVHQDDPSPLVNGSLHPSHHSQHLSQSNNNNNHRHSSFVKYKELWSSCQHSISRHHHLTIPMATSIFLGLVALHDAFLKYLSWRRGVATTYSLAWSWPWLSPSARSLIRFGAYYYNYGAGTGQYWRLVTSMLWVTSSLAEWAVLVVAWTWGLRRVNNQPTNQACPWQLQWPVIYLLSTMTGQLWMLLALDRRNNVAAASVACTSWGTAGVLCAKGMQWPEYRFELFVLAIALMLLNLWQPSSAVWGAIGATFFGWAYASIFAAAAASSAAAKSNTMNTYNDMGATSWHYYYDVDDGNFKEAATKPERLGWNWRHVLAVAVTIALWFVPIVYWNAHS